MRFFIVSLCMLSYYRSMRAIFDSVSFMYSSQHIRISRYQGDTHGSLRNF